MEAPAAPATTTTTPEDTPAPVPSGPRPLLQRVLGVFFLAYTGLLLALLLGLALRKAAMPARTALARDTTTTVCTAAWMGMKKAAEWSWVVIKPAGKCTWYVVKYIAWIAFKVVEWRFAKEVAWAFFLFEESGKIIHAYGTVMLYAGLGACLFLASVLARLPPTPKTAAAAPTTKPKRPSPILVEPILARLALLTAAKPEVEELIEVNTLQPVVPQGPMATLRRRLSKALPRRSSSSSSAGERTTRSESVEGAKENVVVRRRSLSDIVQKVFKRRASVSAAPAPVAA